MPKQSIVFNYHEFLKYLIFIQNILKCNAMFRITCSIEIYIYLKHIPKHIFFHNCLKYIIWQNSIKSRKCKNYFLVNNVNIMLISTAV